MERSGHVAGGSGAESYQGSGAEVVATEGWRLAIPRCDFARFHSSLE